MTKNEDEDYPYSRSESIGMTCLNKFTIDEQNQNEITGVHFIKPWLQNVLFDKRVIEASLQDCPREGSTGRLANGPARVRSRSHFLLERIVGESGSVDSLSKR